jgi:hypothetical protein
VTLPILLFLFIHPGSPPTDWSSVQGAPLVRYRWSRPALNSCLVEIENQDPTKAVRLNATASFVKNNPIPQDSLSPAGDPNPENKTIVRPQTSVRNFQVNLSRLARSTMSLTDCYGIVSLKGFISSNSESTKRPDSDSKQGGSRTPLDDSKPKQ